MSRLTRRRVLLGVAGCGLAVRAWPALAAAAPDLRDVLLRALDLPRLRSLSVHRDGEPVLEEAMHGGTLDQPVNVKSVSKVWISALVGQAIAHGVLPDVRAPVLPLLGRPAPAGADPRVARITLEDLLTMRAGLRRTSGPFYGPWIASRDWVGHVLTQPFVDEPGGGMQYSTGSSHLLSAALTNMSGRSTLALAREWLGSPLGIEIPPWDRDPQGIYLGGNNMGMSPRGLLRFGEMYRLGGHWRGERILPQGWVDASWQPRTASVFTGDAYGYGWFMTELAGYPVVYAWGFGGQLLYIVPALALTVVMTSDPASPSGSDGYAHALHTQIMARIVAAVAGTG